MFFQFPPARLFSPCTIIDFAEKISPCTSILSCTFNVFSEFSHLHVYFVLHVYSVHLSILKRRQTNRRIYLGKIIWKHPCPDCEYCTLCFQTKEDLKTHRISEFYRSNYLGSMPFVEFTRPKYLKNTHRIDCGNRNLSNKIM